MNRKGFTLLELVVVIIILGILATLGIGQYMTMVERSRGAEARNILGQIRGTAAAHYLQYNSLTPGGSDPSFSNARAGIGTTASGMIPAACSLSHYFSYGVAVGASTVAATASRCTAAGKVPNASGALSLVLTSNLNTGSDTWSGTGYQ